MNRRLLHNLITLGLFLTLLTITACAASSAVTKPSISNTPPIDPSSTEPGPTVTNTPKLAPLTATPTATSTPSPTPTTTPTPSPTPTPTPSLRQLTTGGCCVQPFFSPDGQQVLFIDKPAADAPVGIYGVNLANPQPTPVLVNNTIGFRSFDQSIVAVMEDDLVRFSNEKTGQSWTVDTGGNWPSFSPDNRQILWVATDPEGPYDRRQSDLWLADLDGSNAQLLLSLYGGGFAGWFPDSNRILLVGRGNPGDEELTLMVYNLQNNQRTNLFSHQRLRGIEISPGGSWIAFFLSFADEPADNGLWVVNADGTVHRKLDLSGFGAYRWRNDDTLLYIPMRTSADESMQLWAVEATTGQSRPLTNPATLSFSIANGDWNVSPDGHHVIFVNSTDQNIWLITLP
ncbi:MAG: hypothetical protein JXM69_16255 [Anaerolineae bacterium]|nr:hypothetical protein [Anaerolineae bacterium]